MTNRRIALLLLFAIGACASPSFAFAQQADLGLAKTVSDATPNVGDPITFTITLTNAGPDTGTGVQVTDLLPAGLAFVTATPSLGTYDNGTGLWDIGTVAPGSPQTLSIVATVASEVAQTNTASISAADQLDPDPGNNSSSVTETPQRADLFLAKSVSNPTPNVGDPITFTVILTNSGPDDATGVQVTDLLPVGLTFVSASASQGSYNPGTGLWDVGTVTLASSQTLSIVATVAGPTPVTNTAAITNADQFDPVPGNNSSGATVTPAAPPVDLAVIKTVSNPTPNVGDQITFTVTLTNSSAGAATAVQVTDLLPVGLAFVSATVSQGTYTSATGLWDVGTVAPGSPEALLITATVSGATPLTNAAMISAAGQPDPTPANNTASATVTPQQADLAIAKAVSNATPNVGDTITFTITLTNSGPDIATGAQVTDLLPAGLTFVSATPTQGTYTPVTGLWNVGTLALGTPQTLSIIATVAGASASTNTATISDADQFDPGSANNTASATVAPVTLQADLALTKTVSNATPNVGDTITFTVTLTNSGPNPATGVQVTDLLPAGLTFVSATPTLGTYTSATGLWNVGNVAPGTPQTLSITATVASAGALTNTATISASAQSDPNAANNSASATVTPITPQADLALTKTVGNPTPNVGATVTFTITLTNGSATTATGVQVTDLLPAGLTFVSATPSQGTYASATGIWTVGSVAQGTPQTLSIVATVTGTSPLTNTATISAAGQADPNVANNTASATVTPASVADLALTNVANTPTPVTGATFTWTLTATNNGPAAATNVTVTAPIPAGVTFVSATPSQGTYNSGTGVWTIGTLAGGSSATLVLTATAGAPATITFTATIAGVGQADPNGGNNTAASSVTIQQQASVPVQVPMLSPFVLALLAIALMLLGATVARRYGAGRPSSR